MKTKLHKIFKKQGRRPETGGRITNETVAEHRERVLAGGRKFKYPVQYTKHRVLFISVLISVLALIAFVIFFAYQLYFAQAYDKFTYGLTRIFPAPVAEVDGQFVRYSDYLSGLRSSIHYLTTKEANNFNTTDGKRQLEYQKSLAINKAIKAAYVTKLANENDISISTAEVDEFIQEQIASNKLGVSEEVYKQVISDYYDWTFDEYKSSVRQQLLNRKVNATLDVESSDKINQILQQVQSGGDFATIAKEQSEDIITKANGGDVGYISKDSEDPNGLLGAVADLQPGQVSGVIEGSDGFYIVKLIDRRDTGDVDFAKIFVAYKYVDDKLEDVRKEGEIKKFIEIDENVESINQQS